MRLLLTGFFLFAICVRLAAQDRPAPKGDNNPTPIEKDTLLTNLRIKGQKVELSKREEKPRSPGQASLYSAILPGLGQVYNKKYWKVPLIYSGAIVMGYFIDYNHDRYIAFRTLLLAETDDDPRTINDSALSENPLRRRTDEWRRNRDFLIGLTLLLYALNIVDAHVDGHLRQLDVSDDLALEINPSVEPIYLSNQPIGVIGLSLTLKLLP